MIGMRTLFSTTCLVLTYTSFSQAAIVQSDNFNDGVLDSQWAQGAGHEFVGAETGGALNVSQSFYNSGPGSSQRGIETVVGTGLDGAFDIQVDGAINGGGPTAGKTVIMELLLQDTSAASATSLYNAYRLGTGGAANTFSWVRDQGVYTGGPSVAANYSAHEFQLRITRDSLGNVDFYSRELGAGAWDLINSYAGWSTSNGIKVFLQSSISKSGGSISGTFDNFIVPEPGTMGLLALGSIMALVRRKNN